MIFQDKRILITGGTGSLGKNLVRSIMTGKFGSPKQVIVFSRDEDKQYAMELEWKNLRAATDDVFYYGDEVLGFCIGDVRDYESVVRVVKEAEIIIVEGTLYPLLTRLKNAGLLSYRWEESTQGPPRKYYQLTETGINFLSELHSTWNELITAVKHITETDN